MARPVKRLQAEAETFKELQRRARAATSTAREQERAAMVLLGLDGKGVGEQLGTTAKRVSGWCKRFEERGLDGLEDRPGRGRRPSIPEDKVARLLPRSPGRRKAASAGVCAAWATPACLTGRCSVSGRKTS
jgi:transposase